MGVIDVSILRLDPVEAALPVAVGGGALGLRAARDTIWVDPLRGRRCAEPATFTPVATAWTGGLSGHEPPPAIDLSPFVRGPVPGLQRGHRIGDVALVDQVRGNREVRSLAWAAGGALRVVRDHVDPRVRLESLGDGALLLDPAARRLELLRPDGSGLEVGLPPLLADAGFVGGAARQLYVLPELDLVMIAAGRVFWWSASALRGVGPGPVTWRFTPVWPLADDEARAGGEVIAASATYERTSVRIDGGPVITIAQAGPAKGARVALVGKLSGEGSSARWRWLEDATGQRLDLVPDAARVVTATTEAVLASTAAPVAPPSPAVVRRKVARLQELGFLRDATDGELAAWIDEQTVDAVDLFDDYFADEVRGAARRVAEGYLRHEVRYGNETDDLVAELCGLVGKVLLVQRRREDTITVVADLAGHEHRLDAELSQVVGFFERVLAATGDPRRFFACEVDDDEHRYVLATPEAAGKLRQAGLPLATRAAGDP